MTRWAQPHRCRAVVVPLAVAVVLMLATPVALGASRGMGGGPVVCPKGRSTPVAPVSFHPAPRRAAMPLAFVENMGAADGGVRYLARGDGFGVAVMHDAVALSFTTGSRGEVVQLAPIGSNPGARIEALRATPGRVNDFTGADRQVDAPSYRQVAYRELWPGVDLILRAQGPALQYEFHVQPGADPSSIRLALRSANPGAHVPANQMLAAVTHGRIRESRPQAFQQSADGVAPVIVQYRADGHADAFGFELGAYDSVLPLVVGATLEYSTHLGGTSNDFGTAIAVDDGGSAYVTGQTISADFPTTPGAFDATHHGLADAFVAKLDPTGSSLVYSTFLGGTGAEAGLSIAVDDEGQAFVSGGTSSTDFPTTAGAFDTTHNGYEDAWVAKLNASGTSLLYSTFLGGSEIAGDFGAAIAVDDEGRVTVSGGSGSPDFPTTPGAFEPTHNGSATVLDVFVARLNADGSGLVYSTFLGGMCNDAATGTAVDAAGNTYVTGSTVSPDFPTTRGAFQTRRRNRTLDEQAFVAKVNAKGSKLVYGTYLGGGKLDRAQAVALDSRSNTYVTGWTESPDFPTTTGSFDREFNGVEDVFVTKLSPNGARLEYSTYLGGSALDEGRDVAVDRGGSAYVTGITESPNFPTPRRALDSSFNGEQDAFVTRLNGRGTRLVYSTFLGGDRIDFGRAIAVDSERSAYVTGRAESSNFPGSPRAVSPGPNGSRDVFVTKIGPSGR